MTSKLTMHQIGVPAPKKGLTGRSNRNEMRRATDRRVAVQPDGVTAPTVGTEIDIDMDLVISEDEDGLPKTPMTKLRYDSATKSWTQTNLSLAGLLAFFDITPTDDCKRIRVVRLIPSARACYVVPV